MSNTSRFASLGKDGQISVEALTAAIAAMSSEDLQAAMTDEQRADLSPAPDASADNAPEPKAKDKPKSGKGKDEDCANDDGDDEGGKPMATDRSATVFASEHTEGRERLAAKCLSHFPSASANQIVAFLKDQPKAEASEQEGDKELAETIRHSNADLGEGGEPAPEANHGWGKANAKAAKLSGRKPKTS